MKKLVVISMLLICVLLPTACGPSFGDDIYKWVKKNARSYSEQLTRADLRVRWLNQFNETYRTIAYYQEKTDSLLHLMSGETSRVTAYPLTGLKNLLDVQEISKRNVDVLIQLQHELVTTKELFLHLDSIGSVQAFEHAGLRAIGKESLLRSFMEIGDVHEEANNLRYWKLFNFKYSIVLNTETGEVSHEASDGNGAQTYSGSFEGFLASFPLTAPFYALFVKDDIEEQIDRIREALDLFDELSLKPAEQYAISRYYVDSARTFFRTFHQQSDSIHKEHHKAWKILYSVNASLYKEAGERLVPYKLEAAEAEFGGQREISRILTEEQLFKVRQDVVNMTGSLVAMKQQCLMQSTPFDRIQKAESFMDACVEAEYIIKALNEKIEFKPVFSFLQKHEKRIASLKRDAIKIIETTYE